MPSRYIAYMIAPPKREGHQVLFTSNELAQQEKRIEHFIRKEPGEVCATFVEVANGQNRQRHRWPQLSHAIEACLAQNAHLLIGEIRNLTQNESFVDTLNSFLDSKPHQELKLFCLDQPYINKENLKAIVEHTREQRKLHSQLIKDGLSKAHIQPGNPHAKEVICQVNKPKIDNAIAFSILMMPVIFDFQSKGLSQRKMVDTLNDEGFTAPEGGQWVLSQLQKVLARIKVNEAALSLEKKFIEYKEKDLSLDLIADKLNSLGVVSPKGKQWTADVVEEVQLRIQQIHDIIRFNALIVELLPIVSHYHIDDLEPQVVEDELSKAGIMLPKSWLDNSAKETKHV